MKLHKEHRSLEMDTKMKEGIEGFKKITGDHYITLA